MFSIFDQYNIKKSIELDFSLVRPIEDIHKSLIQSKIYEEMRAYGETKKLSYLQLRIILSRVLFTNTLSGLWIPLCICFCLNVKTCFDINYRWYNDNQSNTIDKQHELTIVEGIFVNLANMVA